MQRCPVCKQPAYGSWPMCAECTATRSAIRRDQLRTIPLDRGIVASHEYILKHLSPLSSTRPLATVAPTLTDDSTEG
jgi:hypothetical protein